MPALHQEAVVTEQDHSHYRSDDHEVDPEHRRRFVEDTVIHHGVGFFDKQIVFAREKVDHGKYADQQRNASEHREGNEPEFLPLGSSLNL